MVDVTEQWDAYLGTIYKVSPALIMPTKNDIE